MNVELGKDTRRAPSGSLVFIPAGLSHHNWNSGPGDEMHLEMIIPTPAPGEPVYTRVDNVVEAPDGRQGTVTSIDHSLMTSPLEGMRLQKLHDAHGGIGSGRSVVNYVEMEPSASGPGMHVHEFDQLYFVLGGTLKVEIGLVAHSISEGMLAIVPAGVPHRQWNESSTMERHLAVITQKPANNSPWDYGVNFTLNGIDYYG